MLIYIFLVGLKVFVRQKPLEKVSLKDYFTGILRQVEVALLSGNVLMKKHRILAEEMLNSIILLGHRAFADARMKNVELHLGMLPTPVSVDTEKNSSPIFQLFFR